MSRAILLFIAILCCGIQNGALQTTQNPNVTQEYPVYHLHLPHRLDPIWIVGGEEANLMEFPYMAILGFDVDSLTTSWDCGGTLISNKWVLTVAHCTWKAEAGDVSKVRLGDIDLKSPLMASDIYPVDRIVIHPEYVGNKVYNDIALLKLRKKVLFNVSKSPVCLHVDSAFVKYDKVTAMGFGLTEADNNDSKSDKLMKVELELFTHEECTAFFGETRRYPDGLRNATQVCFGSKTARKDSCRGDSGSPVVVTSDGSCAYSQTVVALTSFGKSCGIVGQPAVYTRISAFAPWIRRIEPNAKV